MSGDCTWQRVRLHDVPATPWRNGGGLTHELLARPAGLWQWRISVARVDADGPFSNYAGVHRQFAVIRGEGVQLVLAGVPHTVREGGDVLAFAGELPCDCHLLGGPSLDFNLMSQGAAAMLGRWPAQPLPWVAGQVAGVYACAPAHVQDATGRHWSLATDELLWTARLSDGPWQIRCCDALVFSVAEDA